ncbi:MAG: hypothetical protein HY286_01730 [Planctomycetes bacterium]|nr:hypothetical protein [Planctomycetota bacterium]
MDLSIRFFEGLLRGDGSDDVGIFIIRGSYDRESMDVHFVKNYPGSHDVYYKGVRDGKGIWGTWEITAKVHNFILKQTGGFNIWPGGNDGGIAVVAKEESFVQHEIPFEAPLRKY